MSPSTSETLPGHEQLSNEGSRFRSIPIQNFSRIKFRILILEAITPQPKSLLTSTGPYFRCLDDFASEASKLNLKNEGIIAKKL